MLGDRQSAVDELPALNMMPMVDIMLCLLIFFMVASRLYDWDEQQLNVEVPEVSEAAPMTAGPSDLPVTILAPGQVAIGDDRFDLDGFRERLVGIRSIYEDQAVQIFGDGTLSYQAIADVLSICEAAGIVRVSLVVSPSIEGSRDPAATP